MSRGRDPLSEAKALSISLGIICKINKKLDEMFDRQTAMLKGRIGNLKNEEYQDQRRQ